MGTTMAPSSSVDITTTPPLRNQEVDAFCFCSWLHVGTKKVWRETFIVPSGKQIIAIENHYL